MARRASAKPKTFGILIVILLVSGGMLGGFFLFQGSQDPFRTIPDLGVNDYLENANSLRGNVYKVDGYIQNSLAWSPAKGRLFSVQLGEGNSTRYIAILVPADFNHVNIQKGQRFYIKIEIIQDGVVRALDLKKV
ncbi:MAG: hypothetical protein AAF984_11315 [Verrucomicrobiota bacterium]